jgi:CRISPR-associated endonuclease/helicase Cas3
MSGKLANDGGFCFLNLIDYRIFVNTVAGFENPMTWQCRLACGDDANPENPDSLRTGTPCRSRIVDIPTGFGKTAGVVLAWIWNCLILEGHAWPRRLVYCLPMRTLVEQTETRVRAWLLRLALASTQESTSERSKVNQLIGRLSEKERIGVRAPLCDAGKTPVAGCMAGGLPNVVTMLVWMAEHSPVVLMGGEELDEPYRQWDLHPEKPAILIGTQDMLLSRALNRGYGMSRYRWPVHFATLNTDCLWVLDEVQLMGSGLTTSLQLQAWRESPPSQRANALPPSHSWWMSATAAEHWFKKSVAIRDRVDVLWRRRETLDPKDNVPLLETPKTLQRCSISLAGSDQGGDAKWTTYSVALAKHLAARQNRTGKKRTDDADETDDLLVLVICNTVERALAVYRGIKDLKTSGSEEPLFDDDHVLLLHSRFRGHERASWKDRLDAFEKGADGQSGARIIVATQVIEAGVDLSASVLYTELCPLPSLIQRLGRCARRAGEVGRAFWIDFKTFDGGGSEYSEEQIQLARPYDADAVAAARKALIDAESRAVPSGTSVDAAETAGG